MLHAAAVYGLTFRCDPLGFLDRSADELPALMALIDIAADLQKKES